MIDLDRLVASFDDLERWSAPSDYGRNGVHSGYMTCLLYHAGAYTPDGLRLRWVLDDYAPLVQARASILLPGGWIDLHQDPPCVERWQIPVRAVGEFVVDGIEIEQRAGVPFLVEQWRPHRLYVSPEEPEGRATLMIDRRSETTVGTIKY